MNYQEMANEIVKTAETMNENTVTKTMDGDNVYSETIGNEWDEQINNINDYNHRTLDEHFSMMPVLAQEFIDYAQSYSEKFDVFVDLPRGYIMVCEKGSDAYVLFYSEIPVINYNSRCLSFYLDGIEYSMQVKHSLNEREWRTNDTINNRNTEIDCETFIKMYDEFKIRFDSEYFDC